MLAPLPGNSPFKSFEDEYHNRIVPIVLSRRRGETAVKKDMIEVATRYNGDYFLPLPEVSNEPEYPALSAAMLSGSVDSFATRANDTSPQIATPTVGTGDAPVRRAEKRLQAWYHRWGTSQLPLKLARAYRHLAGYDTFCLYVEPDFRHKRAQIVTRNPLFAYPEPTEADEVRRPNNVAFIYPRSIDQIIRMYGDVNAQLEPLLLAQQGTAGGDEMWDVLEWTDKENVFTGLLGPRIPHNHMTASGYSRQVPYSSLETGTDASFLIHVRRNRVGMVPGVCPSSVQLDRMIASMKRILPITDLSNKLAALEYIAIENSVIPDRYVLGQEGRTPTIVSGKWQRGVTGEVNLLENVAAVGELNSGAGPQTQQLASNLERAMRLNTNTPSTNQGEMAPSVRSGQTISQLNAASVDPHLKEAHLLMSYALEICNESVAEVEAAFFPRRKYQHVFSRIPGDSKTFSYMPSEIWSETKESSVTYPMPGMDSINASLALANLDTAGFISKRTGREMHPDIQNGANEEEQITAEQLRTFMLNGVGQAFANGTLAVEDQATLYKKVMDGVPLHEAILETQKEAQERQAEMAPEPSETQVAAPETMPGMNSPGMSGGEQPPPGPPPTAGPPPGIEDLLGALAAQPGGPPNAA